MSIKLAVMVWSGGHLDQPNHVIEATSSWWRYEDHLVGDTPDCSFLWEILDVQRELNLFRAF
ncbi:BnaC03g27840D [Brassica napus]|uniref:BnaC03g27840D protein n=1 Tax=Brassica napus TaxID=3708 RepID=A0A078H8B1_BRANA|nr:BnaC03g27840D [Brassica napus]